MYLPTESAPALSWVNNTGQRKDLGKRGCWTRAPVPGTHRDVVGQPLGDAELPNLGGDLFPVAWLGHADGRQILMRTEHGCGH